MREESLAFLKALSEAPSPSGYEQPAQKVFREYIQDYVDEVRTDVLGNTHGLIKGRGEGKLTVMLAGHCDEVGFMAQFIDDHGFLYFSSIGGVDEQLLPGKRVWVHTQKGPIVGVVGRKPIHLIDPKDREKVTKIHDQFIDIGAKDKKEAHCIKKPGPWYFVECMVRITTSIPGYCRKGLRKEHEQSNT